MQTKLALRLDEELIERAKTWAKQRGVSLSETLASFFAQFRVATHRRPSAAGRAASWLPRAFIPVRSTSPSWHEGMASPTGLF